MAEGSLGASYEEACVVVCGEEAGACALEGASCVG